MTTALPSTAQTEADRYGAFVRRILRAYSRRVGDRDIAALAGLADLTREVDAATLAAVRGLRESGYSWAEIGSALGTSKQAAAQRFASRL